MVFRATSLAVGKCKIKLLPAHMGEDTTLAYSVRDSKEVDHSLFPPNQSAKINGEIEFLCVRTDIKLYTGKRPVLWRTETPDELICCFFSLASFTGAFI